MISFETDVRALERALTDFERNQLPFAVAMALNDTAEDVELVYKATLRRDLDRPTPFTMRGVYRTRAFKRRLWNEVGLKDIQSGYLKWQVKGGTRGAKRRAIPVPVNQKLNRYGNMPRGSVKRALARKDTFSGKVKGRAGIWKRPSKSARRRGQGPRLLVAYEGRASYAPRLKFRSYAERKARAVFPMYLRARFAAALRSAR